MLVMAEQNTILPAFPLMELSFCRSTTTKMRCRLMQSTRLKLQKHPLRVLRLRKAMFWQWRLSIPPCLREAPPIIRAQIARLLVPECAIPAPEHVPELAVGVPVVPVAPEVAQGAVVAVTLAQAAREAVPGAVVVAMPAQAARVVAPGVVVAVMLVQAARAVAPGVVVAEMHAQEVAQGAADHAVIFVPDAWDAPGVAMLAVMAAAADARWDVPADARWDAPEVNKGA